jgi:hypothetical protein
MNARTRNPFRRRERHGLHVADPLPEADAEITVSDTGEYRPYVLEAIERFKAQAEAEQAVALAAEHHDWYGWDTTLTDARAPKARPYVPHPLTAELDPALFRAPVLADIHGLPIFRDTIRVAAQWFHADCKCEPEDDEAWPQWFAGQYEHVRSGTFSPSARQAPGRMQAESRVAS